MTFCATSAPTQRLLVTGHRVERKHRDQRDGADLERTGCPPGVGEELDRPRLGMGDAVGPPEMRHHRGGDERPSNLWH